MVKQKQIITVFLILIYELVVINGYFYSAQEKVITGDRHCFCEVSAVSF